MAVRVESGEYLSRTTSIPAGTAATMCCWAKHVGTLAGNSKAILSYGNTAGAVTSIGWDDGGGFWGVMDNDTLGTAPALGASVFVAYRTPVSGDSWGYRRLSSEKVLTARGIGALTGTPNSIRFGTNVNGGTFYLDGTIWNVKVWDRVLSEAELLVESYYRRVVYPNGLNFHWPLDNHNDVNDYGGLARNPTVTGTLSTEDGAFGLWRPRRKQFIPAAAAGGDFQSAWARGCNTVLMPGRT